MWLSVAHADKHDCEHGGGQVARHQQQVHGCGHGQGLGLDQHEPVPRSELHEQLGQQRQHQPPWWAPDELLGSHAAIRDQERQEKKEKEGWRQVKSLQCERLSC